MDRPYRTRAARGALLAASLVAPARSAAQASPVACRVPAERVEWTDRVLLATLVPSDSADRLLSVPVRQLFLDEITARLRARLVPKNDSGGVTPPGGAHLPAADSLYSPLVLLSRLHLTLYGNGEVRDVHVDTAFHHALSPSGGDSLFNEHAREAVTRGIPRSRYRPAEMLGCRVPQLVLQPFSFGLQR